MNISFLSDSVTFQRGEKSDLVAEMGRFFQQNIYFHLFDSVTFHIYSIESEQNLPEHYRVMVI